MTVGRPAAAAVSDMYIQYNHGCNSLFCTLHTSCLCLEPSATIAAINIEHCIFQTSLYAILPAAGFSQTDFGFYWTRNWFDLISLLISFFLPLWWLSSKILWLSRFKSDQEADFWYDVIRSRWRPWPHFISARRSRLHASAGCPLAHRAPVFLYKAFLIFSPVCFICCKLLVCGIIMIICCGAAGL